MSWIIEPALNTLKGILADHTDLELADTVSLIEEDLRVAKMKEIAEDFTGATEKYRELIVKLEEAANKDHKYKEDRVKALKGIIAPVNNALEAMEVYTEQAEVYTEQAEVYKDIMAKTANDLTTMNANQLFEWIARRRAVDDSYVKLLTEAARLKFPHLGGGGGKRKTRKRKTRKRKTRKRKTRKRKTKKRN